MRRRGFLRTLRVNEVIHSALALMIQRGEAGDFSFVSITGVQVSQDLSFAKVFVSLLDEKIASDVITALNEEAKHLRHLLAGEIHLRVIPQLKFIYDDSIVRGNRMASLIDTVLKDKP